MQKRLQHNVRPHSSLGNLPTTYANRSHDATGRIAAQQRRCVTEFKTLAIAMKEGSHLNGRGVSHIIEARNTELTDGNQSGTEIALSTSSYNIF
jgi:hypothetical protein